MTRDERIQEFLADLTAVCRKHGLTLDLACSAPDGRQASDAIEYGEVALTPVELVKPSANAGWQIDNGGEVWWQP